MNIRKTNKLGIGIAKTGFIGGNIMISKISKKTPTTSPITVNADLLRHNPKQHIVRVSKAIIEACKLIDIKSIKDNIDESNYDFKTMFILLDNDNTGVIKVERFGSDFSFLMLSNLNMYSVEHIEYCYNTYSFVAKSFYFEKEDNPISDIPPGKDSIINYEKSVFVVQLLTYLIFGDITERFLKPKMSVNVNSTRFLNNSKLNITFCDTLWKQRISVDGFKVRGHFRLQPVGVGRKQHKLIWIEEFQKTGYNRKATVELIQQLN